MVDVTEHSTYSLIQLISRWCSSHARKQQSELERIARQSKYVLPPRAQLKLDSSHPGDTQVSDRIKLHRELVEQMKKSIKEQNRQRYQQEMEALRKCLTDLALHR